MKYIYIILLLLSFISCGNKTVLAPYDKEFNNERKKVGLRIVDDSFKRKLRATENNKNSPIKRRLKGLPVFLSELKTPNYIGKTTYLDRNNGEIIYEEDLFISGINKAGVDINIIESLTSRYILKDYEYSFNRPNRLGGDINKSFVKGWKYIYTYPKYLGPSSNSPEIIYYESEIKDVTKKEADSILKSWNLKRLNY